MFVLDTNIISDLVRNPRGESSRRLAEVADAEIATSVIVAGELRYGCARAGSVRLAERIEAVLGEIAVLPLGPEVSAYYGEIRSALEVRGMAIGQNDLWIAAHVRCAGAVLVTGNEGEFRRVEGLAVENWLRR
jgi:tRNA(fMet)-specific endonuclease VapC